MDTLSFLENLKVYVGFDDQGSAALREAYPLVEPHFRAIIDDFYDTIEAHPGARAAITGGPAQIQRLKSVLLQWIDQLLRGPHDEAYFERRARIGRVHVQIELPQRYMFTAMDRIRVRTSDVLRDTPELDPAALRRMLTALNQLLDIELAIMLETYREDLVIKNRTAERLATIGQFAAGIGHELRNPLSVVESSAYLLSRRLEQLRVSDPSLARHIEKITSEVHRSNKTISDLLELARNQSIDRRPVNVSAFILQAISAANLSSDLRVTLTAPDDMMMNVDADQLTRVVTNLLINAGQAMNGRGQIWIDARRDGDRAVIVVQDEGPGVAPALRSRIFEALFTTRAKGSGLGLALCQRIVEAHGGSVVLQPSNTGAVLEIRIPDVPSEI